MGMIEDVQAQLDAAESAASQPKTEAPPTPPPTEDDPPADNPAEPGSESPETSPDAEVTTDAADADASPAAATEKEAATQQTGWDKVLAKQRQETADLNRKLDALLLQVKDQGGKPNLVQTEQAREMKDRLVELDAMLNGQFDSFEHAKPALKTLAEELRENRKVIAGLSKKLEDRDAQDQGRQQQAAYDAQVEKFWSSHPPESRKAFEGKVTELETKGFKGERLQGAMDAWWETYTPPTSPPASAAPAAGETAAAAPNKPAANKTAPSRAAGTTPGGARVVPQNTGVRPQPKGKSPQELLADGDVDFFGGRFDRR